MNQSSNSNRALEHFESIIAKLRDPIGGCPWDLEQTHETLKQYLIEECYEVIDAIDSGSASDLQEELGDVLLQVVLHSQLAKESKNFDLNDVIQGISKKIVDRHPHVFGEVSAKNSTEVLRNWEQIKKSERSAKTSMLASIPRHLPALQKAQRFGEKVSRVGFDWPDATGAKAKVEEEVQEFLATSGNSPSAKEELGDLLFSLAQVARKLGLNAEEALQDSCNKFSNRFSYIEEKAGEKLGDLSLDELEELWKGSKNVGL